MLHHPNIAIIGGGIAGQSAAMVLRAAGGRVTVFDKGRGPGGRLASRRNDALPGLRFDHGAQYLTVRDPTFGLLVSSLLSDHTVAPWNARLATIADSGITPKDPTDMLYVGMPSMSALVRAIANPETHYGVTIRDVAPRGAMWMLFDDKGEHYAPFDAVVIATPAPQAVPLLGARPGLANQAASVETASCWALMLAYDTPIERGFDGAFVTDGTLRWIAREASKPGRSDLPLDAWLIHASATWSEHHIDDHSQAVARHLTRHFTETLAIDQVPSVMVAHRWRYAMTTKPAGVPHLLDARMAFGACGDWCLGGRIEAGYLSGRSLGLAMATRLGLQDRSMAG